MSLGISGLFGLLKISDPAEQESSLLSKRALSDKKPCSPVVFSEVTTEKKLSNSKITVLEVLDSVKKVLPQDEFVQIVETVNNQPLSYLYAVKTDKAVYAMRLLKKDEDISQLKEAIGLKVVLGNDANQFVLQKPEMIWPTYRENPQLYSQLMQKIRELHQNGIMKDCGDKLIVPFDDVRASITQLEKDTLPKDFGLASTRFYTIFDQFKPWLEENAAPSLILCPLVLLKRGKDEKVEPQIGSLPYIQKSHPYYDIIEYGYAIDFGRWDRLLQAYLHGQEPSEQQRAHAQLLQYVFLFKQAVSYFEKAQESPHEDFELRVEEMDELLDDFYPLLEKVEEDGSRRQYQRCALYYLNDFLSKTNAPYFTWLLEHV